MSNTMYYDGKVHIWLPSMLTLSQLTPSAKALINHVHTAIDRPLIAADDFANPYILLLNDFDMGGASFYRDVWTHPDTGLSMASCGPIANLSYLDFSYVGLITAFGGDIEGMTVGLLIDDPTEAVPEYFPRSTVDGEPVSWNDWTQDVPGSKVDPCVVDGVTKYKRLSHYYDPNITDKNGVGKHVALLASAWMQYHMTTGKVISHDAFNSLGATGL